MNSQVAGRPRKRVDQQSNSHKTKAELKKRKDEEEAAGQKDFKRLPTTPPKILFNVTAKNEYRRIVPLLNKLDVTALDRQIVVNYCNSLAFYEMAQKDIEDHGLVLDNGRKNPSYSIALDMQKELRANAGQLGMTLDSRMKLVKPEEETDETDPYAELGGIQ